jgi:putative transposase
MSMKKSQKKYSKEEKLQILKEAGIKGVRETLDKYGIYPATYYYWKKKTDAMGEEGLTHSMTIERLNKIKELEQEVDLLKQLLAEKELESRLKDDLLKKKYPKVKRKYS